MRLPRSLFLSSPRGSRRRALLAGAAALGAAAVAVQWLARDAERRHPPRGRFIEVDGVRLHYLEQGQGRPLVLLHGNGALAEDFAVSGLLDLASAEYRVIAFDRPGFGYSQRPRLRRWTPAAQANLLRKAAAALGVESPLLVGHSWGTLVAIAWAQQAPRRVRGLVLLSGYYFPTARFDAALASLPAVPVLGDLLRYTLWPLVAGLLMPSAVRKLFAPAPVSQRFRAEFPLRLTLRPGHIRAAAEEAAIMVPAAAAMSGSYSRLELPVVIAAGPGDRLVTTARQSQRLKTAVARSALRLVAPAGHMIHHTAPEQAMDAILLADQ